MWLNNSQSQPEIVPWSWFIQHLLLLCHFALQILIYGRNVNQVKGEDGGEWKNPCDILICVIPWIYIEIEFPALVIRFGPPRHKNFKGLLLFVYQIVFDND